MAVVGSDSFVVADMPGLIEGASSGHGLGLQFLKHIERTKVLVHVVDVMPIDGSDPVSNFHQIETELANYSSDIAARPRILVLNKLDIVPRGEFNEIREKFESIGLPMFGISAATGEGIPPLLFAVSEKLKEMEATIEVPVLTPAKTVRVDDTWDIVEAEEGGWEITGKRILRMVAMTNLENRDGVRFLHRKLERLGVIERLRELGADEGDTVYVGDHVFSFTDMQ